MTGEKCFILVYPFSNFFKRVFIASQVFPRKPQMERFPGLDLTPDFYRI